MKVGKGMVIVFSPMEYYRAILENAHFELADMESQPQIFSPEQIGWRKTSILLFEALFDCHFQEVIEWDYLDRALNHEVNDQKVNI